MDNKRRKFLKIAGLSAVAGIGAPAALNMLMKGNVQASSSHGHGDDHGGGHEEAKGHGAHQKEVKLGKRYGMVIDVHKFNHTPGLVQKCIDACHDTFNVPDIGNKKDEVKWIWEEPFAHAFPEHSHYKKNTELHHLSFLVTCNHCDSPPCVRACPTQATFKNEDGIVMMDFHRCIGCRFCMAACPYGSRSFNWRDPRGMKDGKPFIKKVNPEFPTRMRGVVEKCNFCAGRLKKGLLPKCVEATGDTKAMVFGDLNDPNSEVSKVLKSRFTIQRKPALGTKPSVFYII
ncbi:MAG: 4Fe-4S dicluster domain-containing protein [Desulfobulbaceae bacterium]|nr:4Fe-4S dicluster domain-containing protein [Desulfobulbaceae bacterium]